MKIENCKTCSFNRRFEFGSVQCGYDRNIVSMAAVFDEKKKCYIILSCPKERCGGLLKEADAVAALNGVMRRN
ncbi:MAG TPA: hypothetical protein PKK43_03670 [Spirochaetota bacterium]|mgnify:CR=1 FL=1|nr:hypothetical protein [Spirochaetota bacterium]